jgi:cation diffusion facilitator family transporter
VKSPDQQARAATRVAIAGNSLLFLVKGAAGLASGSIALISDALNSLVDVAASIGISYSVAVARRGPDEDHPFGHQRAEPLAALGVAIFTGILGFSVGRAAVERLIAGATQIRVPLWALGALLVSMVGNLLLAKYLRRRGEALDSPAILANAVECENDIGTSFAALVGVAGSALGWAPIDPLAGIVVGAWIVVGGYRFGRQNIDYLMGKSPTPELLEHVRRSALGVGGVKGVHDVRGHYVGHRIHVELHIEVDQELRTRQSHDVGGMVRKAIEEHTAIDRAFVHVDPVLDSTLIVETLTGNESLVSEIYAKLAILQTDRPELAGIWRALATRAQARAERLRVVGRLKSAGWHFDDSDLSVERVQERQRMLDRIVQDLTGVEVGPGEAVRLAVELEDRHAYRYYLMAATPQDTTMAASLDAATPPAPSLQLLHERIRAAKACHSEGQIGADLDRLSNRLSIEPNLQNEDVA